MPFLDDVPHGIFATRSPIRPNPIGLSIVRLVERRGRELLIEDVDVFDGTPLLDIKPYVEGFDLRVGTRGGWTEQVSGDEFVRRGERRPTARKDLRSRRRFGSPSTRTSRLRSLPGGGHT